MTNFEIITDGSAEFYDGYLSNNPLNILSLLIDEKGYQSASLKDACEAIEAALVKGNDVLYISMSSALSHSFENVEYIIKGLRIKYPQRKIELIDSLVSSSALGLMVYDAKKMQAKGQSIVEVANYLKDNKERYKLIFLPEDPSSSILNYSVIQSSSMDIKPIFTFESGSISLYAKTIGRKKAILEILKALKGLYSKESDYIVIEYINQEIEANELKNNISKEFPNANIKIIKANEFITKHLASSGIGIAFISK